MARLWRKTGAGLIPQGSGALGGSEDCCCKDNCHGCHRVWPNSLQLVVSGWTGPESSAMNGTFVLTKQTAEGNYRTRCWYRVFIDPIWVGSTTYNPSSVNGYAAEIYDGLNNGEAAVLVYPMSAIANIFETDPSYGSPCMHVYQGTVDDETYRCTQFSNLTCSNLGNLWKVIKFSTGLDWANGPGSCTVSSL